MFMASRSDSEPAPKLIDKKRLASLSLNVEDRFLQKVIESFNDEDEDSDDPIVSLNNNKGLNNNFRNLIALARVQIATAELVILNPSENELRENERWLKGELEKMLLCCRQEVLLNFCDGAQASADDRV